MMRLLGYRSGYRSIRDDLDRLEECVEDFILLYRVSKSERASTPSEMREGEESP